MTLTQLITRCMLQLRNTPLVTPTQLVSWLQQAIQRVCLSSQWLETWTVIPCKASVSRYLLPEDHLTTTMVFYDETRLSSCGSFDAQQVSVSVPTFYYEDEWQDAASGSLSTAFVFQYALANDLMLLQLAHAERDAGRKTLTLVSAPVSDGTALSAAYVGTLSGTATDVSFVWDDVGIPVYIATTTGNLWLWYKQRDTLPVLPTDSVSWDDALSVPYMCATLGLALVTEDDEYDRYRSWMYDQLATQMASALRGMSINRRLV